MLQISRSTTYIVVAKGDRDERKASNVGISCGRHSRGAFCDLHSVASADTLSNSRRLAGVSDGPPASRAIGVDVEAVLVKKMFALSDAVLVRRLPLQFEDSGCLVDQYFGEFGSIFFLQ